MEKDVLKRILGAIRHDLRDKRDESLYRTSKESGLRIETIKKIESGCLKASVGALAIYIDSYCRRFPAASMKIFYNLSILVSQTDCFKES